MSHDFVDLHQIESSGPLSDHYADGQLLSTEVDNHGYTDVFTSSGEHESVVENAMGGHDVSVDGRVVERSIPDGRGHDQLYDCDMHEVASVMDNVHHGHDVLDATGNLLEGSMPVTDGISAVMNYADPLLHLSEYTMMNLVL